MILDGICIEKIAVDLSVEIIPVGHHYIGEIAGHLAPDLAGIEDHREAFARTLGVSEDAQLAFIFLLVLLSFLKDFERLVHTDELMVLGNDLLGFVIVNDEVLDIVK